MSKEFEPKVDIGQAFERMKGEWFYTYRGVTFEKVPAGWKSGTIICRNREEMDHFINERQAFLTNSLNRIKK